MVAGCEKRFNVRIGYNENCATLILRYVQFKKAETTSPRLRKTHSAAPDRYSQNGHGSRVGALIAIVAHKNGLNPTAAAQRLPSF